MINYIDFVTRVDASIENRDWKLNNTKMHG